MAAAFHPGGGSKRRREDEEEREQAEGDAEAEEEDRISALPEALRLHILGLLPLKSAIRTGALSARWRALWTRRWPPPSSLDFRLATYESPRPLLESLERRGRRRLDRFALSFGLGGLDADDLDRCLDYAVACAVEDLHVHFANQAWSGFFKFILPPGDPRLARLSLYGISVGLPASFSARSHKFSVLEVIHLRCVTLSDDKVYNLVAACPLLRTLDLCYCEGLSSVSVPAARAHLKNLTVVECEWITEVFADKASSLQSFRYSGAYIPAYSIPATPELTDLYICFRGLAALYRPSWDGINWVRGQEPNACKLRTNWLEALTNLANLTVLTLCSIALRRVSAKARARSVARNALPCKLQNLRELQLLMFAMYNDNMDDIYVFLRTCCCPQLERLFVQFPTKSNQYDPTEEPSDSDSEEELLEEDGPVKELPEGESPEEDGPMEELSEEEEPKEDELEEELLEGEALEENQLEKDGLEEELSDWGQSAKEPLENVFENLMLLKMTNFKGCHNEMQLVSFVLRKSTSLNQLILLTPENDHPDGPQRDHLNTSHFLETKILPLEKASPNARIILSESDDDAIQPLHLETFVEV